MQLGKHNLKKAIAGLQVAAMLFTLHVPQAHAVSDSTLFANPGFLAVVAAILRLKKESETYSLNPQNQQYRNNVALATKGLSAAFFLLAKEFKKGDELHDGDLPKVQALLGGFVDVTAPSRFSKFFTNPDPSLIPKVGAGFPQNVQPAPLPLAPIVPAQGRYGLTPNVVADNSQTGSDEIVSLKGASGQGELKSLGYDASLSKGEEAYRESAVVGGQGEIDSEAIKRQLTKDLSALQKREQAEAPAPSVSDVPRNKVLVPTPARVPASELSDEVFKGIGKGAKPAKQDVRKKSKRRSALETLSNLAIAIFGITEAHASPAESGQGGCQSGKCGGGGGGGGGGGAGSGDQAAQAMMAMGMMMAGIMPAVAGMVQSKREQETAEAAIRQKEAADQRQAMIAQQQMDMQMHMAQEQNALAERTQTQLLKDKKEQAMMAYQAVERRAQMTQAAIDRDREEQSKLAWKEIEIAEAARKDALEANQLALDNNLTKSGLMTGAVSRSSTSGLTVTRNGMATGAPLTTPTGGMIGSSLPAIAPTNTAAAAAPGAASLGFRQSALNTAARGVVANRLLASVKPGEEEEETEEEALLRKQGKLIAKKPGVATARGVRSSTSGRGVRSSAATAVVNELQKTLLDSIAGGSTKESIKRAPASTDIKSFRQEASIGGDYWHGLKVTAPAEPSARSATPIPSYSHGAYRAPNLSEDTSGIYIR